MRSRVRIRLFHILHFVMDFLFPLLKNSKYGVDDRGHRLRSGSPTSSPGPLVILLEMDRDSRSDPGGRRKVLPFDWLTEEQKIFVNYYDYAALIRSQLHAKNAQLPEEQRVHNEDDNGQKQYSSIILYKRSHLNIFCKGFWRPS